MFRRNQLTIPALLVLLVAAACTGSDGPGTDPVATGSITGLVTTGAGPVAGAEVSLDGGPSRSTGSTGSYFFDGIEPGTYTLTVSLPEDYSLAPAEEASRSVTVRADTTVTASWLAQESGVVVVMSFASEFAPAELSVPVGTMVRWVNVDVGVHTVTPEDVAQAGVWQDAEMTSAGDIVEHTFAVPEQTYRYRCVPHSVDFQTGMIGSVEVTP